MIRKILKKLSSRKLWLAIVGFISALGVAFGVNELTMEQVTAVIGALGTLCAYIIAEGYTDASHSIDAKKEQKEENKS
jgi:hypothetical protein